MTEMKPCPFCGGEVELRDKLDRGYGDETSFIHCTKCHMWFEKFDYRGMGHDNIIKEWNTRTTDKLKDLLIDIDSYHELLGTELLEAFHDGYFDPDANFTPLEHRLKLLYEALGFNEDEIRNEAYKLSKERLGDLEDDL